MLAFQPTLGALARSARGLRMRLVLSYALLFAIVFTSVGLLFREALTVTINQQSERLLDEAWVALKGYLKVRNGELVWAYDPEQAEESYTVERLRRVLLLADLNGQIIEISNGYAALGVETISQIQSAIAAREPITVRRSDARGAPYLVRMGVLRDADRVYFAAIGIGVEDTAGVPGRIIGVYFTVLPVILVAIAVLGWFAAGRALRPLMEVAAAAQAVSAGNLSLRLTPRLSGDELDTLIATFNGMMQRLEANFEQMKQFSVDASHELRTPITAIRGQLEVALFTARSADDYRQAIETALQDVERLGHIVRALLQLAQAESGQLRLQRSRHSLPQLIEPLLAQHRLLAEDKQISILFDPPDACLADVDRIHFDRLISNLLSNAVQYTQPGGQVRLSLSRTPSAAVLEVSDNGPGIAEAHLSRIFEKFYRIREGDRGPDRGVGLGLSFVAWIVKAHDGEIRVRSRLGLGTTFIVSIPDLESSAPAPAAA